MVDTRSADRAPVPSSTPPAATVRAGGRPVPTSHHTTGRRAVPALHTATRRAAPRSSTGLSTGCGRSGEAGGPAAGRRGSGLREHPWTARVACPAMTPRAGVETPPDGGDTVADTY